MPDAAPEAARRQARLQEVESRFAPIPIDAAAARSYGLIVGAVPYPTDSCETGKPV